VRKQDVTIENDGGTQESDLQGVRFVVLRVEVELFDRLKVFGKHHIIYTENSIHAESHLLKR